MLQWIADKLRQAPRRVEIEVVAKFTRELAVDRVLRSRIIDVCPLGLPTDRRIQLERYLDDWGEWAPVGEFSIDDGEAFANLIEEAVRHDRALEEGTADC